MDYMPEKYHVAHFINGLVDSLEIHHSYEFGSPREYSLSAVLKSLLIAYTRGVFTSRKINVFVQENMPTRWLTKTACHPLQPFVVVEELQNYKLS